jgi:hypothetical protein
MVICRHAITKKSNLWPIAIGDPEVQITVLIPVDSRGSPTVIRQVEAANCRNIGESATASIEETAMTFATAKRAAISNQRL